MAGKRVVVTGASRGLGKVIAASFSRAGALVALVARSREALDEVVPVMGGEALVCPADVTSPEGNRAVVDAVEQAWGGLDVWIANAGISPVVTNVLDMDPDVWRDIQRVNLDGAFLGAQAAARSMAAAGGGGGRIIVTTSALAERPRRGLVAYSASKAGATAMVKAMALDLGKYDITVNAVAPGWFDSPLAEGWQQNPELEKRILDHTAQRRWGRSEDLPGAYLFLASDAAAYITGAVLTVDGGYVCV